MHSTLFSHLGTHRSARGIREAAGSDCRTLTLPLRALDNIPTDLKPTAARPRCFLERCWFANRAALTFSVFMLLPIIAEGHRVWASKIIHNLALRGGASAGGLPVSKERRLIRLEGGSCLLLQAVA